MKERANTLRDESEERKVRRCFEAKDVGIEQDWQEDAVENEENCIN